MKPVKLIDIKAELAVAQDNVNMFNFIKGEFLKTMYKWKDLNIDFALNTLCYQHDMKREDFNFIMEIEKQCIQDVMNEFKRKKH